MNYVVMTRHKYKDYMTEIQHFYDEYQKRNWKKAKTLGCDILYTFLHYYRHLGQTPGKLYKGTDMAHVMAQFQFIIHRYHLNQSISMFHVKQLKNIILNVVPTFSLWIYTVKHRVIRFRYDFKKFKNSNDIIKVLKSRENKIHSGYQLCVWYTIGLHYAEFDVVNYNDIICKLPTLKNK